MGPSEKVCDPTNVYRCKPLGLWIYRNSVDPTIFRSTLANGFALSHSVSRLFAADSSFAEASTAIKLGKFKVGVFPRLVYDRDSDLSNVGIAVYDGHKE